MMKSGKSASDVSATTDGTGGAIPYTAPFHRLDDDNASTAPLNDTNASEPASAPKKMRKVKKSQKYASTKAPSKLDMTGKSDTVAIELSALNHRLDAHANAHAAGIPSAQAPHSFSSRLQRFLATVGVLDPLGSVTGTYKPSESARRRRCWRRLSFLLLILLGAASVTAIICYLVARSRQPSYQTDFQTDPTTSAPGAGGSGMDGGGPIFNIVNVGDSMCVSDPFPYVLVMNKTFSASNATAANGCMRFRTMAGDPYAWQEVNSGKVLDLLKGPLVDYQPGVPSQRFVMNFNETVTFSDGAFVLYHQHVNPGPNMAQSILTWMGVQFANASDPRYQFRVETVGADVVATAVVHH
ncbi:hypothetical protein HK101_011636 [Irineochytrium annulatum]|nr:hypothetical protein HK101_011636 [Irineochytrium annulatum]